MERDAADIAAKLRRLRDEPAWERLGRAVRRAVEAWDWSYQAANYAAMFRQFLEVSAQ